MPVHPGFLGFLYVLLEGIRRHGDDRNAGESGVGKSADRLRCRVSIHNRHLYIHQDHIVVSRLGRRRHFQRDLSILRRFDQKSRLIQQHLRDLHVDHIVFDKQCAQTFK